MDKLERAYYEVAFKATFLEKRGDSFQDFFCGVMSCGYPSDFMRFRPWGKRGDRKNDGYLKSKRMLFQIYAPNEMNEKDTVDKIDEDFHGALPYWEEYFSTWVFAHNSMNGLGPVQGAKILELRKSFQHLEITDWGFESLRREFFRLDEPDLISLLGVGRAPDSVDFLNLRYEQLKFVVYSLTLQEPRIDQDMRLFSGDKLKANDLSDDVKTLLEEGLKKSFLVGKFFRDYYPDPTLGEGIAETFRQRYAALRSEGKSPDEIFHALHMFAGGTQQPSSAGEAAVLAVMAHLFEKCDIFEKPLSED